MSDVNPYQTPGSDVSVASEEAHPLASRGERLGAAMLDGLFVSLVTVPTMYLMGIFHDISIGQQPPKSLMLALTVIGFLFYIAINYIPLSRNGQTIGKKLVKIRIADLQGNKPDLTTLIVKRFLPMQFVGQIPIVGSVAGLVDLLFIFRKDHRCVHDRIAGTQVVRVKE